MKAAAQLLKSDPVKLAIGAGIVVGVLYLLGRQTARDIGKAGKAAADAVASINEGTPYEGTGVVGTIAHGADAVSGGGLSAIGGWLGGKLDDWFGAGGRYDPNAK